MKEKTKLQQQVSYCLDYLAPLY